MKFAILRLSASVAALALLLSGPSNGQAPPPADLNQPAGHEDTPARPAPGTAAATALSVPPTVVTTPITANVTVTDKQLLNAGKDMDNWPLHGRTYDNQRYSPLTQINKANVKHLLPVSIIQTGVANSFEATPIVVNGILYIATAGDHVQAYDAVTGRPMWSYTPNIQFSNLCCGLQSRGVAVAYGKVFLAQLDATVVALDARTGQELWKSKYAQTLPPDPVFYSYTMAPQVYDGMVVVGSAGAEYPSRGFLQAYDANTGNVIWRFRTTAAPDEPGGETWSGDSHLRGGGSIWSTPAVDPKSGTIGFAVGNPNPDVDGHDRLGDNAYTDSIVGVDARTGKLKWWNQQVPHDVWDYDSAAPVIFMDAKDKNGKMVPAAAEANKQGNVYIVNRLTGERLRKSDPFVLQSANFMTQPPPDATGRIVVYPASNGGSQWSPAAYSPRTQDFYVMGVNEASYYSTREVTPYKPGTPVTGQVMGGRLGFIMNQEENTIALSGTLSAVNVNTGKIDWQHKTDLPMVGGVLATASDLVFTGELDGNLDAFDAKDGKKLWAFNLGAPVGAPPITYRVKGVQYVAVAAGGLSANGWPRVMIKLGRPIYGDVIAIFALPGKAGK